MVERGRAILSKSRVSFLIWKIKIYDYVNCLFYSCRNDGTKSRFDFDQNKQNLFQYNTSSTESEICDELMVILFVVFKTVNISYISLTMLQNQSFSSIPTSYILLF